MYGTAVMPTIPTALIEAAAELCPNVEVRLLDGHNLSIGALARAASDAFLSLVDCLQETFGLTPVEAMASRLPVVASDWNGYRDTVVDGRTGFCIPTQSFAWLEQSSASNWPVKTLPLMPSALHQQPSWGGRRCGRCTRRLSASPDGCGNGLPG